MAVIPTQYSYTTSSNTGDAFTYTPDMFVSDNTYTYLGKVYTVPDFIYTVPDFIYTVPVFIYPNNYIYPAYPPAIQNPGELNVPINTPLKTESDKKKGETMFKVGDYVVCKSKPTTTHRGATWSKKMNYLLGKPMKLVEYNSYRCAWKTEDGLHWAESWLEKAGNNADSDLSLSDKNTIREQANKISMLHNLHVSDTDSIKKRDKTILELRDLISGKDLKISELKAKSTALETHLLHQSRLAFEKQVSSRINPGDRVMHTPSRKWYIAIQKVSTPVQSRANVSKSVETTTQLVYEIENPWIIEDSYGKTCVVSESSLSKTNQSDYKSSPISVMLNLITILSSIVMMLAAFCWSL